MSVADDFMDDNNIALCGLLVFIVARPTNILAFLLIENVIKIRKWTLSNIPMNNLKGKFGNFNYSSLQT